MAGEKELEEGMYALTSTMEGLTQRIGELQVDLINLRQEVAEIGCGDEYAFRKSSRTSSSAGRSPSLSIPP